MTGLRRALCAAVGAALATATFTAAAHAQERAYGPGQYDRNQDRGYDQGAVDDHRWREDQRYDHEGGPGSDRGPPRLEGPGVYRLMPELRDSPRGRAFVLRRFDFNHDGFVQGDEARAANRAFLERDRRRWDGDDRRPGGGPDFAPPPPPPAPPAPPMLEPRYDRGAMREYHFRQNTYGAVFSLPDVLFETGSARLRPAANAKLRPLVDYLRGRPAQRLRIDGYTDAVGTAQANLILSRDRARSVADALSGMGVNPSRFQLDGHGEDSPAASNRDAAGRQLNRRVEVTLIGRSASTFQ